MFSILRNILQKIAWELHVETVVFLSQQKPGDRIGIDLNLDAMDVTSAETMATYPEIKDYMLWENMLFLHSSGYCNFR